MGTHTNSTGFPGEHVKRERGGKGAALGVHEAADEGHLQLTDHTGGLDNDGWSG